MHDVQATVAAGYDAIAEPYAALEHPEREWPRSRLLREVLARLPAGSTVLDLGCGNGIPALREIAKEHKAGASMFRRGRLTLFELTFRLRKSSTGMCSN